MLTVRWECEKWSLCACPFYISAVHFKSCVKGVVMIMGYIHGVIQKKKKKKKRLNRNVWNHVFTHWKTSLHQQQVTAEKKNHFAAQSGYKWYVIDLGQLSIHSFAVFLLNHIGASKEEKKLYGELFAKRQADRHTLSTHRGHSGDTWQQGGC